MVRQLAYHWRLAAVVALATMAVVTLTVLVLPRTYTASAVVAMVPRPGTGASAELLQLAIPTYRTVATSESVVTRLADRYDTDADRVHAAIRVENPPASNTLLVTVEWSDARTAARLTNSLTVEMLEFTRSDPLLTGFVVADASTPTEATWPPMGAALLVGAMLAVGAGVAAAVLNGRRRPRVASPADTVRLVEEEGSRVPLLLVGARFPDAAVTFVSDTVRAATTRHGDGSVPYFGLVAAGRHSAQSITLAARVAITLYRSERRVLLILGERERAAFGRQDLAALLPPQTAGRVTWGVPAEGAILFEPVAGAGKTAWDVDLVLVVSDRLERVVESAALDTLGGVVTVVMPGVPARNLRGTLGEIRAASAPHLAVLHWLGDSRPPSAAARLIVAPFRARSARGGERQEPRPELTSPLGTAARS